MRFIILWILFLVIFGCITPEETEAEPEMHTVEEYVRPDENISETEEENETPMNESEEINETIVENETNEESESEIEEEHFREKERILFGNGRYALVVEDVVWYGDKSCAAVSIGYADGSVLKKDVICPQVSYYWVSPYGYKYRIFVSQVAAGYTGETWAEVYVYG